MQMRYQELRFPCSSAPQNEPSPCNNPTTCQSTQSKSQEQTFTSSTSLTHPIQSDKVEVSASESINAACLDSQKELIQVTFEYENMPSISSIEDENETKEADLSDFAFLQRQCDDFKHIINYLESNTVPEDKDLANLVTVVAENQYVLDDNVLYHIYTHRTKKIKEQNPDNFILQLALPTSQRKIVLASYHDCKAGGGHFGIKRTFAAIKQKYWWPKMYQQVKDRTPCAT